MRRFTITMTTGLEGILSDIILYREERDEHAEDFYRLVKTFPNVVNITPYQKKDETWPEFTELLRKWEDECPR